MTATVTHLDSRRRARPTGERGCFCRPGYQCPPHRVTEAADRLQRFRVDLDRTGALLVPLAELEAALAETLKVLGTIVDECLPHESRRGDIA